MFLSDGPTWALIIGFCLTPFLACGLIWLLAFLPARKTNHSSTFPQLTYESAAQFNRKVKPS
jgi:hypothetical protein